MYIGRFLIAAPAWAAYRVSSRSFPHRDVIERDNALAVVPTENASPSDNPYISYHCLRITDELATIGNGSHVDPIAEKLQRGYPPRDALATGLFAMDYEKDDYDTPRIAAVITQQEAFIGIVRKDALLVESVDEPTLVATYELDEPTAVEHRIDREDAAQAARGVYDLEYEHPVCAAAVRISADDIETGIYNGSDHD